MKREPVNSSTIVSAGWQEDTLELEFASGGVYRYENVSKEKFEAFMRTESKGHFFFVEIRPNHEYTVLSKPKNASVSQNPNQPEIRKTHRAKKTSA